MKAYTDIEQSRKLSEILPHASADMHYARIEDDEEMMDWVIYLSPMPKLRAIFMGYLPCWSLAKLLDLLELPTLEESTQGWKVKSYHANGLEYETEHHDDPVDACVDMIIKLNKLDLLRLRPW